MGTRGKQGNKPSSQRVGFPSTTTEHTPETSNRLRPWIERVRKVWREWPGAVASEAAHWGKSMSWDRPDVIQISAPPLTSSVTLGTFLKPRVPYLFTRNVAVLFSKDCYENEIRKQKA